MENSLFNYKTDQAFEYENGFYLTSHPSRMGKLLAHFELYKKIINLPGQVVECGVFKGASLIRLASFREMLEGTFSRMIIGFDAFGKFPRHHDSTQSDRNFIEKFENTAGMEGITVEELERVFEHKNYKNIELVKGDIIKTIPEYLERHPELKISLLHIDVDVYHPTKVILENLYKKMVKGGIIILDDYSSVAGETKAVDEFFKNKNQVIKKLPISHVPAYIEI